MDPKILSSSKINPTKLLGGSSFANNTNNISEKLKEDSITISKSDLSIIKGQVFEIKNLVTNLTTLKKKRLKTERKETERERFDKREKELEKKKKPEDNKIKLPQAPKLGFLDIIRRFVVNTLIGFIAIRLIKHLPKMIEVVKFLGGAMDFITNVGGNLLNGLATFVQKGYEAYDATRGLIKNLGGENFAKGFDKFISAIDTALFLTTALAGAMAVEALTSDDDPGVMDLFRKKKVAKAKAVKGVTTTAKGAAAKGAGIGAGASTAIVAGAGLLASALGEGAFQVRKFAVKPIEKLENDQKNDKNPLTKIGRGVVLTMVRPLFGLFQGVGFLLDIIGAPFRYAIELIRYPFLSEEDKVKQANNLAKLDARIREDFRKGLNMLTLGLAFKEKGSFGNIYGNKGAQKEMMGKMQGGGQAPVTRGGKIVSGPRRSITKSKVKRQIAIQPTQLKPGADVGGEKKIEKVFPKSKDKNQVSPLDYIEKSYKNTNQDKSFGSLLNLQTKSLVGQKPSKIDYKNAAQGLSNWMTMTFSDEILRTGAVYAAGGGEINADMLSKKSGDMTDAIARSLEDSISKRLDANIDDLMKQMMLKKGELKPGENDSGVPGPFPEEGDVFVSGGNEDFWTLVAVAFREDADPQGQVDVAQSIYNRLASGAYSGKTIRELILARTQYQPTWDYPRKGTFGIPNPEWRSIKDAQSAAAAAGVSVETMKKTAANILNPTLQKNAREFIQGRTDFKAQNQGVTGVSRSGRSNVFGWHYNYRQNKVASVPNFGATATTAPGSRMTGPLGVERVGAVDQFTPIAKKFGLQVTSAYRPGDPGYHGKDRARDYSNDGVGRGTPQQLAFAQHLAQNYGASLKQLIYTPLGFGIANGKRVGLDYWGSSTNAIHYDHVHVAFFHGGFVPKDGLYNLHKGEFVVDKDSVDLVGKNFIATINAIENKTQLQQKAGSLIGHLSYITGYEPGGQQQVVVEMPEPEVIPMMMPVPIGGEGCSGGGGPEYNSDRDGLYAQG
jgi:hypothetical protein